MEVQKVLRDTMINLEVGRGHFPRSLALYVALPLSYSLHPRSSWLLHPAQPSNGPQSVVVYEEGDPGGG